MQSINRAVLSMAFALLMAPAASVKASAEGADAGMELGFVQSTAEVTLLNEGGKFVTVDMKKIEKGGKCRIDKDSVVMKVGPGATAGTTLVKFAAPQLHSGGCPFLTEFELPDADYAAARAAFTAKTDEAQKKIDDLKKELGDKWNEVTGQTKP
jgi:hypothetical protein